MGRFLDFFSKGDSCRLLLTPEGRHVEQYRHFKALLEANHEALSLMAELEQMVYHSRPFGLVEVRKKVQRLSDEIKNLLEAFQSLSDGRYSSLWEVFQKLKSRLAIALNPSIEYPSQESVLLFENITPEKRILTGAKAGNLSVIKNELRLPVPEGFAVTAVAYERFIEENKLSMPIEMALSRFDPDSLKGMDQISTTLMNLIRQARIPEDVQDALLKAYDTLEARVGEHLRISMRSSAIGEDTESGFAGQFQTVLNVRREGLLEAYKTVLASKYSTRALLYRYQQGLIDPLIPMAVAGLRMIDAKASGVLYSRDPEDPESTHLKISSLWGLGEHLVDGSTSPDQFLVDREGKEILKKTIRKKKDRLISRSREGTILEGIPESAQEEPSLSDKKILQLATLGLKLEDHFGSPQDVEWALDQGDQLFLLQSRPLNFLKRKSEKAPRVFSLVDHPILVSQGQTASPGIALGPVFIVKEEKEIENVPQGSILVAKTASPNFARFMGRIKGIITDIGSSSCHLASVAREFGIPALFDTRQATSLLFQGQQVTLQAGTATVYEGRVETLADYESRLPGLFFESPVHLCLRKALDWISPLQLTDPHQTSFSPEGCRTYHDIIRFTHELGVKEMFGLSAAAGKKAVSVRLTSTIPLVLYVMDLGEGLQDGLSTCETVTPDHFTSLPMKALWKGFTHPGITWSGSINFDLKSFMTLMAAGATSEFGDSPGGDSYALLSRDYLNFSAKFGYHFATVDALCGENSSQNYIALQFSGGAGSYFGRSLRIYFLSRVLEKLGFLCSVQGDLLEASFTGYDRASMETALDQLGRLLATSRLLDMALTNEGDIERLTELFFKEEYDYLSAPHKERIEGFYVQTGDWKQIVEDGRTLYLQDGSKAGFVLSSGLAKIVARVTGPSLQEFLDSMEAYYYFPLIIARNSEMADGSIQVEVKAVRGNIDQAGGIAFGIKNAGNYFVFRINALEDNIILFEYINNKRFQRALKKWKIRSNRWYRLKVKIQGTTVQGVVDGEPALEYQADREIIGHVGLWTKADSVTAFRALTYGEL